MGKHENLIGRTFGELTVIGSANSRRSPNGNSSRYWLCKCSCGVIKEVKSTCLTSGKTKTCGSGIHQMGNKNPSYKNGNYCKTETENDDDFYTKRRLYRVWNSMKQRCSNPNCVEYNNYGGRGISVCQEWKDDFNSFYSWCMKNGYDGNAVRGEYTIDRIDNNGNYEPNNCRLVTIAEQNRNKSTNVYIYYNEKKYFLKQLEDMFGISHQTLSKWKKQGMSDDEIMKRCKEA